MMIPRLIILDNDQIFVSVYVSELSLRCLPFAILDCRYGKSYSGIIFLDLHVSTAVDTVDHILG